VEARGGRVILEPVASGYSTTSLIERAKGAGGSGAFLVISLKKQFDGQVRQLMYGGDLARAGSDLLVLAAWLVGALVLSMIGVRRMIRGRTLRDLQPSLIG